MSYYILPKYTSNKINICATWTYEDLVIINSPSLIFYLNNLLIQLSDPSFLSNFTKINNSINTYKYLYSKIPTYNLNISKLSDSQSFYIYIELINITSLFDSFTENITSTYITSNNASIIECVSYTREKNVDIHISKTIDDNLASDMIIIDVDPFTNVNTGVNPDFNMYIMSLIKCTNYILTNQNIGGVAIFKIDHFFYKPVLDILFILNMLYKQIYIIKPQVSNTIHNEIYIVCKYFIGGGDSNQIISQLDDITKERLFRPHQKEYISSIISDDLPAYFLNKIEEATIIIVHQKIQYIDYIINYKINSNTQKHNIQKCIQWCEKYKIPYNKITDKMNIFLHPNEIPLLEDPSEYDIVLDIVINPEPIGIYSFTKQIELLQLFNTTF